MTRIEIKVLGSVEFFNRLSRDAQFVNVCADGRTATKVDWKISLLGEPAPEDFLNRTGAAAAVVVESNDSGAMNKLRALDSVARPCENSRAGRVCLFPIIAVCENWSAAAEARRRAPVISEWTVGPIKPDEIFHRAMFSISKHASPKRQKEFGLVRILHDSRTIVSGTRSQSLTEFEISLAEFFLSKAGTTVSITRLVDFFREAGRSAKRSNMRVAIFGLRAKLEEVTNSRVKVVSVYRQGYSLRQSHNEMSTR
jgi:DNA-binding response OmpR family regulator